MIRVLKKDDGFGNETVCSLFYTCSHPTNKQQLVINSMVKEFGIIYRSSSSRSPESQFWSFHVSSASQDLNGPQTSCRLRVRGPGGTLKNVHLIQFIYFGLFLLKKAVLKGPINNKAKKNDHLKKIGASFSSHLQEICEREIWIKKLKEKKLS